MANSIVNLHRQKFPNDGRSDEELTLVYSKRLGGRDGLPQDFLDDLRSINRGIDLATRPSLAGEFKGAVSSGVDRAQAQLYDTVALGANKLGLESVQAYADRGRERNLAEAGENVRSVHSIEEVEDFKDFAYWFAGVVGENAPQLAGTLGTAAAATGGAVVAGASAPVVATAGLIGGAAAGFTQTQNFGDLRDEGIDEDTAGNTAIATGFLSSLLEAIPVMKAISPYTRTLGKEPVKDVVMELMKKIPSNALVEGGTEVGQEFVTMVGETLAHRKTDPDYEIPDKEFSSRIINAGVAGAALGGALGPVEVAGDVYRGSTGRRKDPDPDLPPADKATDAFFGNLGQDEQATIKEMAGRSNDGGITFEEATWLRDNPERRDYLVSVGGNPDNVHQPVSNPVSEPPAQQPVAPAPAPAQPAPQPVEVAAPQPQPQPVVAPVVTPAPAPAPTRTESLQHLQRFVAPREVSYTPPQTKAPSDDVASTVLKTRVDGRVFETPSVVRAIAAKFSANEPLTPGEQEIVDGFSPEQNEQFTNMLIQAGAPKAIRTGLDTRTLEEAETVKKQGVKAGEDAVEGTRLRGFTPFPLKVGFKLRSGEVVEGLDHTVHSPELDEILSDDSSKPSSGSAPSKTHRYVFFEDTAQTADPKSKVVALPVYRRTRGGRRIGRVGVPAGVPHKSNEKSVAISKLMKERNADGSTRFVPLAIRNAHDVVDAHDPSSVQYFSRSDFDSLADAELREIGAIQRGAEASRFQQRGFDESGNVIEGRTVSGLDRESDLSSDDPITRLQATVEEILGDSIGSPVDISTAREMVLEFMASGPEEAAMVRELYAELLSTAMEDPLFSESIRNDPSLAIDQIEAHAAKLVSNYSEAAGMGSADVKRLLEGDNGHASPGTSEVQPGDTRDDPGSLRGEGTHKRLQPGVAFSIPVGDSPRMSGARVIDLFSRILRSATANGINVRVFQQRFDALTSEFLSREGGAFDNASNTIALVLHDIQNPNLGNIRVLLHEIAHHVFRNEPARIREVMAASIDALGRDALKINPEANRSTSGLDPEEILVETAAQSIDPATARSLVQRLLDFLKGVYLRASLEIQSLLHRTGVRDINPHYAQEYADLRLRQLAFSGDVPSVFKWFMGGDPKPEQRIEYLTPTSESWIRARFNPATGRMETVGAIPFTAEDAVFNTESARFSIPSENAISPDQGTAQAVPEVAALRKVSGVLKRWFESFDGSGENQTADGKPLSDYQGLLRSVLPKRMQDPEVVEASKSEALKRLGKQPVGPEVRLESLPEFPRKNAARQALILLNRIRKAITKNVGNQRFEEQKIRNRMERRVAREDRLITAHTDADEVSSYIIEEIRNDFSGLKADGKAFRTATGKITKLSQMIGKLDASLEGDQVPAEYQKAAQRVLDHLTRTKKSRIELFDIMDFLVSQGVDWHSVPLDAARRLITTAASSFPELKALTTQDQTANVLTTALVHFLQKHSHVEAMMKLRKEDLGKQRDEMIASLKAALKGHTAEVNRAEKLIRSLPRAAVHADRILQKIKQIHEDQRADHARLQQILNLQSVWVSGEPVLEEEIQRLESMMGAVGKEFNAVEGETYPVPDGKGGFRMAEFHYPKEKKESAALIRDMKAMSEWLDTMEPGDLRRGSDRYNQVLNAYEKIRDNSVVYKALINRDSWIIRFAGSLVDKLDLIGNPSAQAAARKVRRYAAFVSSVHEKFGLVRGRRWATLEAEAMKAAGFPRGGLDEFRRTWFNRAFHFFARNKEILIDHPDLADAYSEAFKRARRHYMDDPSTRAIAADDKKWAAMRRYWEYTAETSDAAVGLSERNGIKVDDKERLGMYRDVIGAPLFEVMRAPSDLLHNLADRMKKRWTDHPLTKAYAGSLVEGGIETLDQSLAQHLGGGVWEDFVGSVAEMSGRAGFHGPAGPDGTRDILRTTAVKAAYRISGGSVSRFIQALHQAGSGESTTESVEDYAVDVLSTLNDWFRSIHGMSVDRSEKDGFSITAAQPLMNARLSESFPEQWVTHRTYGVRDLNNLLHTMGYNIAFGRNLEGILHDFSVADAEIKERVLKHKVEVVDRAQATGKTGKALRAEMVRLAGGEAEFKRGENAIRDVKLINEQRRSFAAFINSNHTSVDWGLVNEGISGMVGAAVQGLKTALVDTSTAFKPIMEYGFSRTSIMMSLSILKGIGANTANSAANALPFIAAEGDRFQRDLSDMSVAAGFVDADNDLSVKETMVGEMHSVPQAQDTGRASALSEKARLAMRGARTVLSVGIGKSSGASRSAKLQAPFTFISKTINLAAIQGAFKIYGNLVMKMVEAFESNPSFAADPDFEFTAEQLGFRNTFFGLLRDKDTYAYLSQRFQDEMGMTLETAAREAMRRNAGKSLKTLFTPRDLARIGNIAMTDLTQESSATTTPSSFLSNPALHAMLPLLNWAIRQTVSVSKSFSTPGGGRWDAAAIRKGFLGMAFGAIPIGLLYSVLVDEFEKEVLGKKANVLDFGGNPFFAMVDKLARVGTFGLAGDAVNSMINLDTARPFSIDSRVFAVSSFMSMLNTVGTGIQQGAASWETVGRPLAMSLGGAGYLSNFQIINNTFGLDNEEARVNSRINVNNHLRAAGREVGMEVRTYRGGGITPSKTRVHVKAMLLAAMGDDHKAFFEAYKRGVEASIKTGKTRSEAEESIKRSFQGYHPMRSIFRTPPTERDIRNVLQAMDDTGREDVLEAMRLIDIYTNRLGIKTFTPKRERSRTSLSTYVRSGF
jgi:hypothetical protein